MKFFTFCVFALYFGCLSCCKSIDPKTEPEPMQTETQQTSDLKNENQRITQESLEKFKRQIDVTEAAGPFDVPYKCIAQGSDASVSTAIIRSPEQANSLQRFDGGMPSEIDFTKQALVIVTAGQYNTGGYSIYLKSAVLREKNLVMTFAVSSPAPDEMVTMALTYPYVAVLVDVPPDVAISIKNDDVERKPRSLAD